MKYMQIGCLLAGAISAPASAWDWGLQGRAGYTYSDNVAQAPVGDSADIMNAEISALIEHASRTLVLDAEANYIYRHFLDEQYNSEGIPQLRGSLEWLPVPERFRVTVTDTYGQLALNPAEGLLPSAYEDANVLTAEPAFVFPFSLDTRMQLTGQYRNTTFSESRIDTQRRDGEFRIDHDLTRLISMHLGVSRSRTEVDDEVVESAFDSDSAFVGLDAVGRRSALFIDVGVDSLKDRDQTFEGTRFDLNYERQLSSDNRIFIGATRELADAADVFALAQMGEYSVAGIRDVQVTSQPFQRDAFLVGYASTGRRLGFALSAGYRKEDYVLAPDDPATQVGVDRDIRELLLTSDYVWSPSVTLELRAEFLQEEFVTGIGSDDLLLSFSWRRQFAPNLFLQLRTERIERTHSPRDFEEVRYFLTVDYSVRELRVRRAEGFDRAFERRVRRARDAGAEPENPPAEGVPAAGGD